jgi:hypothetical protein
MGSKVLRSVDGQGELLLIRKSKPLPVALEIVHAQPSFKAAIRLAANVSGLEEKEIYLPLKIDAGHWTRMMNGDANFPDDKLEQFMDLVENDIPLEWLAFRRGKGLVMLEGEAERLLRLEREKNQELAKENRLLREIAQGRAL